VAAKTTIGQLPQAAALTGTEKVPLDQNGQTVQTTAQALAGIIGGLNPQSSIAPAAIGALQHDWNPPGLATASIILVSSGNVAASLDGIVAPTSKKFLLLLNANTAEADISIVNATGSGSAAQNQFLVQHGANIGLGYQGGLWLWYDTAAAKWRVVA
jgi:hypothetical protein